MNITRAYVFGFEPALIGMRMPMDSWDKSDSSYYSGHRAFSDRVTLPESPNLGENDLDLAIRLIKKGTEHRKFMRQIQIWLDITVPRYVWTELDTYKVATVRNSCSTMNKLGSRDLVQEDFQYPLNSIILDLINSFGAQLRSAKISREGIRDSRAQLKNILPEGYLQRAMLSFSYETALAIINQRKHHRLPEWRLDTEGSICRFLFDLPYMKEFYGAAH